MNEYRVDKQELPVVLFLSDGAIHEGVVFLSPFSSIYSGPQTILELFREEEAFLPFRDKGGQFILINKSALTHVRYPRGTEADQTIGDKLNVRITFFGGELLEGILTIAMPAGQNRLMDYINASPGFFILEGEEFCYLANGALVREISPVR